MNFSQSSRLATIVSSVRGTSVSTFGHASLNPSLLGTGPSRHASALYRKFSVCTKVSDEHKSAQDTNLNPNLESLLLSTKHHTGTVVDKDTKEQEPGPLHGIRVLDLTRVLGKVLLFHFVFKDRKKGKN